MLKCYRIWFWDSDYDDSEYAWLVDAESEADALAQFQMAFTNPTTTLIRVELLDKE